MLHHRPPPPPFDILVFEPVMIGLFVGLALALAQALQMDNAYWVPVSCLAVIQEPTRRAVWNKQLQRTLGTAVGLLVAWGLVSVPMSAWHVAMAIMTLSFLVESLVVRHYGLAAIFITPLAILLAEAATLGHGSAGALMQARFVDTVLGCVVGLAGALCMHHPALRARMTGALQRILPTRSRI